MSRHRCVDEGLVDRDGCIDGPLTKPWQIAHERLRPWLLLTISPPIRGRNPQGILGTHSYNEDRAFADLADLLLSLISPRTWPGMSLHSMHFLLSSVFTRHARRTAVQGRSITWSYAELDRLSAGLAQALLDRGAAPGQTLPILMGRSP